ncbi:MAG TPA: TlpA disulfide reductase family protein [Candidatus Tectomicrobia bacterium]|nr:TlpA disulfide reductase family protein [Candidatus Tectomicrobia bacterium]
MAVGAPALGGAPALTATQLSALDLTSYTRPAVPPGFSLRMPDGQLISLTELRGTVVIVNFWSTWCRECLAEMAGLETLHRRLGPRGLVVIGIGAREGAAAVQRYAREQALTFPMVVDPDGAVTARYGVIGLPSTFVIDRDGRAVALAIGAREWGSPAAFGIVETLLDDAAVRGTGP